MLVEPAPVRSTATASSSTWKLAAQDRTVAITNVVYGATAMARPAQACNPQRAQHESMIKTGHFGLHPESHLVAAPFGWPIY